MAHFDARPATGAASSRHQVAGACVNLFRAVCEQDMERIVAKRRDGLYDPDAPTWVKIIV